MYISAPATPVSIQTNSVRQQRMNRASLYALMVTNISTLWSHFETLWANYGAKSFLYRFLWWNPLASMTSLIWTIWSDSCTHDVRITLWTKTATLAQFFWFLLFMHSLGFHSQCYKPWGLVGLTVARLITLLWSNFTTWPGTLKVTYWYSPMMNLFF